MVAVAVNATLVPWQIAPLGLAAMLTLAGTAVFTDIVMLFDVAGDPDMHVAFDVRIQVITLPSASVEDV